ncbi:hypothetical protein BHE74_00006248 [Ensete ventricosum]|nr:hypothetical protein BHE74_00006248 [Ensete ventricosum]
MTLCTWKIDFGRLLLARALAGAVACDQGPYRGDRVLLGCLQGWSIVPRVLVGAVACILAACKSARVGNACRHNTYGCDAFGPGGRVRQCRPPARAVAQGAVVAAHEQGLSLAQRWGRRPLDGAKG